MPATRVARKSQQKGATNERIVASFLIPRKLIQLSLAAGISRVSFRRLSHDRSESECAGSRRNFDLVDLKLSPAPLSLSLSLLIFSAEELGNTIRARCASGSVPSRSALVRIMKSFIVWICTKRRNKIRRTICAGRNRVYPVDCLRARNTQSAGERALRRKFRVCWICANVLFNYRASRRNTNCVLQWD